MLRYPAQHWDAGAHAGGGEATARTGAASTMGPTDGAGMLVMKIESVRIKNFRSFRDVTIPFNDYTCLVGANGAGKSTVLTALNIFFRDSENVPVNISTLDKEDFHAKDIEKPIIITITFANLSDQAKSDFPDYFRQGKLIVSAKAEYEETKAGLRLSNMGNGLSCPSFRIFQSE